jgi:NADH-quinone oxidoreductase subunit M
MGEFSTFEFPILTAVIFFPLIGILLIAFVDRSEDKLIKGIGIATLLVEFFISIPLFIYFNDGTPHLQFAEYVPWLPNLGISYHLGIDGISVLLIMLTTFLGPIIMLSIWTSIDKSVKEFVISMLMLQTAMLGAFSAVNLFLFYIFWELMLIPMYLIIGVWGGKRRIYATIKFFLFTMVGSLLMLVAILVLYQMGVTQFGQPTMEIFDLYNLRIPYGDNIIFGLGTQHLLFLAFALAFAIKVPMFPFHTWLPDAHVEAPTAGSVVLAAVLLKMGTYGFIRLAIPLFPSAAVYFTPLIIVLAVIGIVYGALVAMVQPDMKKLVAYSSVSHLGFVMLGMMAFNSMGVQGSILQMINHGLSTGALFLLVGMLYERRHTRMIADFGGIAKVMPVFTVVFMIVTLSSVGLPGTNGFVGEFLILIGAYTAAFSKAFTFSMQTIGSGGRAINIMQVLLVILATTGVVFAAVYMLWMFQRVMFGKITNEENSKMKDLSFRELCVILPIIAFIFIIGLYPNPFLKKMEASVNAFNSRVHHRAAVVSTMSVRPRKLSEKELDVLDRANPPQNGVSRTDSPRGAGNATD